MPSEFQYFITLARIKMSYYLLYTYVLIWVTLGDERFVDFVDFIKILFYILFLFIKTIDIRLSSNPQIYHRP